MNLILPLRIAQAVLAIIVLGLAAYPLDVVGYYPQASFLVFTSVWSFVVLAYLLLTPMYRPELHNRWVVVGLEAVTMIFWFAGFIAMADSTTPHRYKCYGPGCSALNSAKAAAAMGAFAWLAWLGTFGLIVDALIKFRKGGNVADPDAGNNTTPGAGKQEEGTVAPQHNLNGQDIEMNGGGQKQQQQLELNLPDPVHLLGQQQAYGRPSSSHGPGIIPIPSPADFGGLHEHSQDNNGLLPA